MNVFGADMHKDSHTVAAVAATTGELRGDQTIEVGDRGVGTVLDWGRGLGDERVWALEDCRHVSGAFERFWLVNGERVVRVAKRLMAGGRRASRARQIRPDRRAGGRPRRPTRRTRPPSPSLSWPASSSKSSCWLTTASGSSESAPRSTTICSATCTTCRPEQKFPKRALLSKKWGGRIVPRLARLEQTARVRITRGELKHLRELSSTIDAFEAGIAELVDRVAPQLLAEPGFGPLTADKLIGEIAGAQRFSTDAKLARAGGIAPIPASSGKTDRHRLDRREPPDQHRHTPRRRHPREMPSRNPRLHRPQARRRQEHH